MPVETKFSRSLGIIIILLILIGIATMLANVSVSTAASGSPPDSGGAVPLLQGNPQPSVRIVVESGNYYIPGSPFYVTVYLKNTSSSYASTSSYLDISFPNNTSAVSIDSYSTRWDNITLYTAGQTIYNRSGAQMTAQYPLISASDSTSWGYNVEAYIRVRVTPSSSASTTLNLYYRGTMNGILDPTSGTTDQQGWNVKVQPVYRGYPNLTLTNTSVPNTIAFPYDTVTANARVTNSGTVTSGVNSILGLYFSTTTSAGGDNFNNTTISALGAGSSSSTYSRDYVVPDSKANGSYYVVILADSTNAVDESSSGETDNKAYFGVTVARPSFTNYTISTSSAVAGTSFTANFYIYNPDNVSRDIGLGLTIRNVSTGQEFSDASGDVKRSFSAGTSTWQSRSFLIASNVPPGTYDVIFGLHDNTPSTTTHVYATATRVSALTVIPTYTVSGYVKSRRWPYFGVEGIRVQADSGQSALTDQSGYYTIPSVPSGSRTFTASDPDSDYWATGTSDSQAKSITLSGNSTLNFTDFAGQGTSSVTLEVDRTIVPVGETFYVTVRLNNAGLALNNIPAFLDLSFAGDKIASVGAPSGSGWTVGPQVYPIGSTGVWGVNSSGQAVQLPSTTDYLVTAERRSSFSSGSTYSFVVPITLRANATAGTLVLKYRGTIGDERDPDSTGVAGTYPLDQQGWNVKTLNVSVVLKHTISGYVRSRRWPYFGVEGIRVQTDSGQSALTDQSGYYTIPNVPDGSRTVTASDPDSDYWATGTSDSQAKSITLSSDTTVNFTDFAGQGTASVEISVDQTAIAAGETVNVTVRLTNTNLALNNIPAFLDLSFAGDKIASVGAPSGSGWTVGPQVYPIGSTGVWGVNNSGQAVQLPSTTEYLVTAERRGSFSSSTTYTFTVPITLRSDATAGTIVLKYRGTIGDERDPDSTGVAGTYPLDQQGWNVKTYNLPVIMKYTVSGYVRSRRWPYFGIEGIRVQSDSGQSDLTDSTGYYSIEKVPAGSRTFTASDPESDFWATGTQSSQAKSITLNSSTTLNFTDFAVEGTASVVIEVDQPVIAAGETVNVTVRLTNTNFALNNVAAFLDLSFDDEKIASVGTPTGSGWTTGPQVYPIGSTNVWGVNSSGQAVQLPPTSEYLVSGERRGSFQFNTTYSFTVPITLRSDAAPGTITLKYRGTIEDDRDPDSTGVAGTYPLDQQGWNVKTLSLTVVRKYTVSGYVRSRRWPYFGIEGIRVQADSGQSGLTDSYGNYTIPGVPNGARTFTASDPDGDFWATGTNDTQAKSVTINGDTTVNFTDFAGQGTASAVIEVDRPIVTPGQTFNVTVRLTNTNYALNNVAAFLDVSFDDEKIASVGTPSGSGWTVGPQVYPIGSSNVWGVNSSGQLYQLPPTSEYLVSGERRGSFQFNTTYSFTVPVTIRADATPGTITLKYRGTIDDERDPDSSGAAGTYPLDQQGWNVKTFTVEVQPVPPTPVVTASAIYSDYPTIPWYTLNTPTGTYRVIIAYPTEADRHWFENGPELSRGYDPIVKAMYVEDSSGQWINEYQKEREIALMSQNMAEWLDYGVEDYERQGLTSPEKFCETRSGDDNQPYYVCSSSLLSTASRNEKIYDSWFLWDAFTNGIDDPATREEIYRRVLYELIIQEMNYEYEKRLNETAEAMIWRTIEASADSAELADFGWKLLTDDTEAWGVPVSRLAAFYVRMGAANHSLALLENTERVLQVQGRIDAFQKTNLIQKFGVVLSGLNLAGEIKGKYARAMLLNMLADAAAMERLTLLDSFIDHAQDPALRSGWLKAKQDFDVYSTSVMDGFVLNLQDPNLLVNFASFIIQVGTYVIEAQHIAQIHTPVGLYIQMIWGTWSAINEAQHKLRASALAMTLEDLMYQELEWQELTQHGGSTDLEYLKYTLGLHALRAYLAGMAYDNLYSFSHDSLLLKFSDWLLNFFHFDDTDDIYAYFTSRREEALGKYNASRGPDFLASDEAEAFSRWLHSPYVHPREIDELEILLGQTQTFKFIISNTAGGNADPAYLDISVSSQLDINPNPAVAPWTRYNIGYCCLWKNTDTTQPTLVARDLLYSAETAVPVNTSQAYNLIIVGKNPGPGVMNYRTAMAPPGYASLIQRDPTTGTTDQQGWPVKTIPIYVLENPKPTITANTTSLNLVTGELVTVKFTVKNDGGPADASYIDVSLPPQLEVISTVPGGAWDFFAIGDSIYFADGSQGPAQVPLYSLELGEFPGYASETYEVTFVANQTGSYEIKYRASLYPRKAQGVDFRRAPTSANSGASPDQQGWYAWRIPVQVTTNREPVLSNVQPTATEVQIPDNECVTFSTAATDPDGRTLTYRWLLDDTIISEINSYTFCPEVDQIGPHNLMITVSDGILATERMWAVAVVPACYPLTTTKVGQGNLPVADPPNSASCPANRYNAGENIQLSAQPMTGWRVASWTGTTNNASTSLTNALTMPDQAHSVGVTYEEIPPTCYLLTTAHSGEGSDPAAVPTHSATCAENSYLEGEIIQLQAIPADNWRTAGWTGTDNDMLAQDNNTLTMPASDRMVTAHYEVIPPPCYPLTVSHTGDGADPAINPLQSTGCPANEFVEGETVYLTADPADNWTVGRWYGTDSDFSTAISNTITMPGIPHSASVEYVAGVPQCYTLALSANGSGAVPVVNITQSAGCALNQYVAGQNIQLTASPTAGWTVVRWSGTQNNTSTATTNAVIMPGYNHAASVFYEVIDTPLGVPSDLSASAVSLTQAQINWVDNSSDETAFHVERSPDGITSWGEIGQTGANITTYLDNSVSCGLTYSYRVRASRSNTPPPVVIFSEDAAQPNAPAPSYSGYSAPVSLPMPPCAAVPIFEDDFSTDKEWTNQTNGRYYRDTALEQLFWQARRDEFQMYSIPIVPVSNQLTFRFKIYPDNLISNIFLDTGVVEAFDINGYPTGTFIRVAQYGGIRYIAPYGSYTDGTNWYTFDPAQPSSYIPFSQDVWYEIEMVLNGLNWTLSVYQLDNGNLTGQLTGTLPAIHSAYNYFAVMNTGLGDWPTGTGWTDDVQVYNQIIVRPFGMPSGLHTHAVTQTEIDLGWLDTVFGETQFRIERAPAGTSAWAEIGTTGPGQTRYQDSGLTCSTAYQYRVRAALNPSGYSAYSALLSVNTVPCPPPAAPSTLSAAAVTRTQINLAWVDHSSDETAFYIERSLDEYTGWAPIGTVSRYQTTYQDKQAQCETTYFYRVRAYRSGDGQYSEYSNTASALTGFCLPGKPALVSPSNGLLTADNLPTLHWQAPTYAVSYHVQVDVSGRFLTPLEWTTNSTTVNITLPLADNTTYVWHVRALNVAQEAGPWSDTWVFTIDTARPSVPVLSSPRDRTNIATTTPRFIWAKVAGATQYWLQVDDDPNFGSPANIGPTSITTTSYLVPTTNALPYGDYYWRVQAGSAAGLRSDWSVVRRLTVTLLRAPANAAHLTDDTPTLSWTKPTGTTAFEFKLDNSGGVVIAPVSTGVLNSYTPLIPLDDGQYWWSVHVQTINGWSAWMPAWTFTITAPPTLRPALVSPSNGALWPDLTPIFTWGTVTDGHHYQIQIDNDGNFSSPLQDVVLDEGVQTYTAAPLPDGGKYFWRVRAINVTSVAGAWGGPNRFTLTQLTTPILALPLNNIAMQDRSPDFSWGAVLNANSYQIQISTDPTFVTLSHQAAPGTNSYTVPDENALPDGVYSWRVRAVSGSGIPGKWSGKRTAIIDNTGPAAPVLIGPTAKSGTADTTPTFKWKVPKDGKTYYLQVTEEDDPTFANPAINMPVLIISFTPLEADALDYGGWLWRVRAFDALGNGGDYSPANLFDITLHRSPADGAATTSLLPTFSWVGPLGALSYEFELATDADFNDVIRSYSGPNKSFKPAALTPGTYYWHVKANNTGWMLAWTITITPPLPAKPVLTAPLNGALVNDNTPTLNWNSVTGTTKYRVQIDNNTDFSSPAQDVIVSNLFNFIAGELPDGTYVWRVRAINSFNAAGAWSSAWKLSIDSVPPAVPVVTAPVNDTSMTNTKFSLAWVKVKDAVRYEVQIDLDPAFPLPLSDAGNKTTYKPATPLARGDYFWHVRAIDKAGNASDWSPARGFTIVAGVTSVEPTPLPTLDILPTDVPVEPTVVSTPGPTVIPPDLPLYTLESDDPAVAQTGIWTAYDTSYASGGRYLYSSGSLDDALTLRFSGVQLDVIYVKHPALGQFVVEVDGAPLLMADCYAMEAEFGARTSISLSAGEHTARLYPLSGTVAIDAFTVQTQIVPPIEPTVLPTTEPTFEPTSERTLEPTLVPTLEPTIVPTDVPAPILLPFGETFDSGLGWTSNGVWVFDTQSAHSGAGWWADSTQRGLISSLTYNGLIDLTTAQNPQLRFWQKGTISAADVLSIEVSLDGGVMWWPAQRQSALSTDWTWQTIDLSAYRGNVIALRIVLTTLDPLPEGAVTVGLGLDDLLIQEVPPVPTQEPTVVPTGIPTEILTDVPTEQPTEIPTAEPTIELTPVPTEPAEIPAERQPGA